ncbi:MAG TPA: T9SS type A sorting domain-containing protein [Salinivirgaceae bacterium]|nr:T9SS type A sorting domain-containing protein [Salinivirgaceae bacterium]
MKNRIFNISLTLYCLLIFAILIAPKTTKAQKWSEPITIFQGTYYAEDIDFVIDNNNHIHVVWAYYMSDNLRKILYSKSTDYGETWSEPYDIVNNVSLWMCDPKIAVDSDNKLYVTYSYNAGSTSESMVHMQIFNGNIWGEPIVVSKDLKSSQLSSLVMDNRGTLHIFWHYFQGKRFRYRTYSNGSFSPIYNPYPNNSIVYVCCVMLGKRNDIHMTARETPQSTTYMTYLKKVGNEWTNPDSVCKPYWASMSMAIGKSNEPHIVWVTRENNRDITYYTTLIDNRWQTSKLTPKRSDSHSMIVELNGTVHIVQSEKTGTGYNQMHYTLQNGICVSRIIESAERGFYCQKLIAKDTLLFLIYEHFLLNNSHARISLRKLKIENQNPNSIEQTADLTGFTLRVFPNPSKIRQGIKIETNSTGSVQVEIYNIKGFLVFKTTAPPSQNIMETKIPPGVYLVKAISDKQVKTETIVITE